MSSKRPTFDVFVGNLPHDTAEKTLSPLFTEVGEVSSIRIINSRKPDGSKIAYVKYFFEPDAEAAVAQRNGYLFGNSVLVVKRCSGPSKSRKTPEPGMAEPKEPETKRKVLSALLAQNKKPSNPGPIFFPPAGLGVPDEQMVVCEVRDVTSFFAQRMVDVDRAIQLGNRLAEFCPQAKPLEDSPEFRKVYAARFSKDQLWYRCRILQKVDASRSLAQYVDYGNCEHVTDSTLVLLTGDLAEMPPLAMHCRLDGLVGVRRDEEPQLYAQAMSHVQNILRDQLVLVQRKKATTLSTHFLTRCFVPGTGIDLAQELLIKGYAKCHVAMNQAFGQWDGAPSRGMAPKPSGGAPSAGPWVGNPWNAPSRPHDTRFPVDSRYRGQGDPRMALWYPDKDPRAHEPRGQDLVGQDPRGQDPRVPDLTMQDPRFYEPRGQVPGVPDPRSKDPRGSVPWEVKRPSFPDQSSLVRKLNVEKESLKAQLLRMESRVRALELQVAEQGPKRVNLDFLSRLSQVLESVEESRLQRERFSTGGSEDVLERALGALGSCPPGLGPSTQVEAALCRYQHSQDAIRACSDTALLEPLKLERDAGRSELMQELQVGLQALDADELQGHVQEISARLEELKRVYGDFLGTSLPSPSEDSPEVLGQQLAQHKAERADDFRKKREDADSARGHFVDALQMLQQAVQSGTSIPGADGRRFSLGYLEACLSNLHHSIQAELAACNLALSADKSPLARLVWRVHNLLTMYLERASSRSVVQCQHTALLEELRPLDWDASQCMAQAAMEAKRLLRKLKSRLRHRLADLEDLESGDEEERQRVTEEIAKLRQEVQVALSQEEYLLDRLALEQCKHFPELDLLFPDLQLSLHQKYAGLLKSNWELSSFELEGSTLQTRFLAEKMLLRECAIDSPESKELLLSRTASYARVSCKHLLRIRAAFLSKNERHVYLLVPRPAPSLSERRCAPRHAQKALEHVLRALHELHKATGGPIAHGAVHPEMVLFDDQSEEAVLDLPLWTLRSGRSLLPSLDGIDFVAPEQRGGPFCRPSPEGDMYSLGCLALWMLFPGTLFKQTPAGIPDISVLESSQTAQPQLSTIRRLLKAEPQERLTAKEALTSTFFLDAPHKADPPQEPPATPAVETNQAVTSPQDTPQDTSTESRVLLRAIEVCAMAVREDASVPALQDDAREGLVNSFPQDLPTEFQDTLEARNEAISPVTDEEMSQEPPQVEHQDLLPEDTAAPDASEGETEDTPEDAPLSTPRLTVAQVLSIAVSTKSKHDPEECSDVLSQTGDSVSDLAENGDYFQPAEQMLEVCKRNAAGDQVDGTSSPLLATGEDQATINDCYGN
ncbi:serine/threonine-protein kinase 31 [Ixodes scapularis]|uniref:serine/threonine-protein kinase 31 n=1 Tax=Ixodes scapularis TaxID=6945 RepID=UPI001A9CE652|nr:serine/threonine-protein kinase 31 [Ixodes scapularis]